MASPVGTQTTLGRIGGARKRIISDSLTGDISEEPGVFLSLAEAAGLDNPIMLSAVQK
jgi:hypothetical protein